MSSSMPIPPRKPAVGASSNTAWSPASSSSSSAFYSPPSASSSSSSSSTTPGNSTPSTSSSPSTPNMSSKAKQKAPMSASPPSAGWISPRRPSLLGSSFTRSEYTVVNVSHSHGPPRLVTCVKSSQGFDWNQELFLPSYAADFDARVLEHRSDPVEDIILSDEEAAAMMPQ